MEPEWVSAFITRIEGYSLNWTSEFHFKSDVETLNKLLEKYAAISGISHH